MNICHFFLKIARGLSISISSRGTPKSTTIPRETESWAKCWAVGGRKERLELGDNFLPVFNRGARLIRSPMIGLTAGRIHRV